MRFSTGEKAKLFKEFNSELDKLYQSEPLKDISKESPHVLQIITFHLVFEHLIEKWIDFKINSGKSVFKGVEKIGFHNKLYIAKNVGLPIKLFKSLNKINEERNKFAHKLGKQDLTKDEINKILDELGISQQEFDEFGVYDGGRLHKVKNSSSGTLLLFMLLQTLLTELGNFVFIDIHLGTSEPFDPQNNEAHRFTS
ncbi:hypothetical protein BB427_18870 [Pseudoalteromonas sp. BMB]|uniref:hypothetical protein n=1 Tax=Pseudoalteromonas sp. BMB TaxID=1874619 RepID=UPI00083DA4D4|nr:hypothetical protein [Pseudoalteromonas sp. BMB]ODB34694.1 hypothetical protein BB427_18870 [Pseudoalteromonas sp. BMB]